jgi:hypothetical protein
MDVHEVLQIAKERKSRTKEIIKKILEENERMKVLKRQKLRLKKIQD